MTDPMSQWTEMLETRGMRLLVIAAAAFLVVRLLKSLSTRVVERARTQTRSAQMREQQTTTLAGILYSAGSTVVIAVAVLSALPELGFNVTPFAAAAGLASLAVGFGAQNLVKDVINGFFIIFEDQYVVGDIIRASGETGRVEHLTLRRTVIRNERGAMISIPNGLVGQVANLSRDWSQTFLDVLVASSEAIGRVLSVLEKVTADFRQDADWTSALVDGPRVLGVETVAPEGTTIKVQVRTALLRQDDVARELRRRIKIGFEEAGITLSPVNRIEVSGQPSPPPGS
jgi:small-conductance mechanosensitive channel